jgi:putative ABC transport system permease protein
MEVFFADGQTEQERETFRTLLGSDAKSIHFFHQSGVDLEFDDQTKDVYMIVSDEQMKEYFHFNRDGQPLELPGHNEVYISVSAAENMGIRVGDSVALRDNDMRTLELTVSGIFDNHVYNYAVVNPETVQSQWGAEPDKQMAVIMVNEGTDIHQVGTIVSNSSDVINVSISEDTAVQVKKMLEALDLVVITVVVCAGALAVIVLYNLTNISITERVREIATIKVLGFNAKETALYVFKENLLLTVMGAALGLGGGVLLLEFVMSQIKVDMVWMFANLNPWSYLWAILLTLLSAALVDFLLYFKLEKINMAEALKSVE